MSGLPILSLMLAVPTVAAIACIFAGERNARFIALAATLIDFALGVALWAQFDIGGAQWQFTERADLFGHHNIKREALSVRQRMTDVLAQLEDHEFHLFESLFTIEEGRLGIVVAFLAILELAKENLLEITQNDAFAQIYVRSRTVTAEVEIEVES